MALNPLGNRDYRWWVGSDGNIWANVEGLGVKNYGAAASVPMANRAAYQGFDAAKEIADPNSGNKAANPSANGNSSSSGGGGGSSRSSSSSSSSYNAEEEAMKNRMRGIYDRQISDINHNIDSMQSELDNALASIKGEYNQYKNEQQSAYNSAKNDYDKSTLQNRQDLQSNRNDITDRASSGLRGLLRILGAMGAGGGSVARFEAPGMVTSQANQEFSNAGQTYARNQSNLDTDWGNYKNEFENDKKKLEDWYNGQVKAKTKENYEKRNSLLSDLVTAYGNRAQYGGDYGNSVNDAYNRIAEYRNKITDLGKYTAPKYTGITAVYNAPDLATYNTGNTDLSTAVTDSNTSAASPLLVALQGLNKKKNNSPYANLSEA